MGAPCPVRNTKLMLNTIILLIPVMLFITALEWCLSARKGKDVYSPGNFAMNLAIGAMDQVASLVYFTALYFALSFVYENARLFSLSDSWYNWLLAYIAVDFLSYWYHRFSHRVNILWAGHVTHHSAEHYNFSNGFRTSFLQGLNRILFWSLLPVFGFSPVMLVIILKVSGLYDFLLHNQHVPKLGFLEKIFVTPSQHRVHHGRNDQYIDKNYGSTFVIWDKIFGTFCEETEEVEYGIKGPYLDNNPFNAIGYYYVYLWRAMKMSPGIFRKIGLLFLPPEKTPKPDYETQIHPREAALLVPSALRQYGWALIVLAVAGLLLMLLFKNFLPDWEIVIYSAIGISSIATGAMIVNGNYNDSFASGETFRHLLCLLLAAFAFGMKPQIYVLTVALYPLLALFYFMALQRKYDLLNSES